MLFKYKIIDEKQDLATGKLEAVDLEAAKRIMYGNGWQIIEVRESSNILLWLNKPLDNKLSYEAISNFCTQMAMMIRTGSNIVKGLEILKSQTNDKKLKTTLEVLITEVSRGSSLSDAMKACKGSLPELLVNLVAIGEMSGNLDIVFKNMSDYYDRENFIRKKVISAAVYPVVLTVVLIMLVAFFINFILPEIATLFSESGGQLPLITRMVISSTTFLAHYFWLIILLIGTLVMLYFRLARIPGIRLKLDILKLRLPLVGRNINNLITARYCRTMALFLKASIPIVPILNAIEKIMGNEVPRLAVARAKEKIVKGKGLAEAFGEEQFFDEMVIQMMTIGEETGQLDDLMEEIANYYDKQVEIGITRMVALVEPIFTIIIGILAALMIISIALPIFDLSENI